MTETDTPPAEDAAALRSQLDTANQRLILAELKSHAIRAGIIDLDCLRLVDTSALRSDGQGNILGAENTLANLKRDKPWFFTKPSTSHPAPTPTPEPPNARKAKDMSHREWQTARDRLIRGR